MGGAPGCAERFFLQGKDSGKPGRFILRGKDSGKLIGRRNNMNLRYYILFANYEQGLALRDLLLQDKIPNRIAPAPRAIQGDLSCGMSLLIEPEHIDRARRCIEEHNAPYHRIASLEGQIRPHRDHYC